MLSTSRNRRTTFMGSLFIASVLTLTSCNDPVSSIRNQKQDMEHQAAAFKGANASLQVGILMKIAAEHQRAAAHDSALFYYQKASDACGNCEWRDSISRSLTRVKASVGNGEH